MTTEKKMPFKAFIVLSVSLWAGLGGHGSTVTWKANPANDWDWTLPGNFEGGALPAAGDTVVVPAGTTVRVKASDSASAGVVSQIVRICPVDAASRIVFETANASDVLTVPCRVSALSSNYRIGEMVKTGPGEVRLTNKSDPNAYMTKITVQEGALRLPSMPGNEQTRMYYGVIHVAENAMLFTGTAESENKNLTCFHGLTGSGLVTNDSPVHSRLVSYDGAGEMTFAGRIAGNVILSGTGRLMLTGVDSTITRPVNIYGIDPMLGTAGDKGVVGVRKFGNRGEPSSIGSFLRIDAGGDNLGSGGGCLYLGETGETTDKDIYPRQGLVWIDGGAFGGVDFAGQVILNVARTHYVLTGSNAVPCRISGKVLESTGTGLDGYQAYFTKKGSGAWRFATHAQPIKGRGRNSSMNFAVEDGSLQFDSLRPGNECCALGMATNNVGCYIAEAADDEAHRTDYVFLLGGTNALGEAASEGTLEPVAGTLGGLTNCFFATDRPIALKGHGRILMNAIDNGDGVERRFTIRGVKSAAPGNHVLTLDGSGTNDNTVADIVDGPVGTVSVVKRGTGTWVLAGTNTFSGELAVKAGRLVVNAARDYTWYRLSVSQLNEGGAELSLRKLALFDAAGADQTLSIQNESQADRSILRRGRVADGRSSVKLWGASSLRNLFASEWNNLGYKMYGDGQESTVRPTDASNGTPDPSDPDTWYWIDFRLPADANGVTSYDLVVPFNTTDADNFKKVARGWQLLGSVDGVHYEKLHEVADAHDKSGDMHYPDSGEKDFWLAAQKKWTPSQAEHAGGQPIAASSATAFEQLSRATVSVDSGATLEVEGSTLTIGGFRVSKFGIGTLRNVAFAKSGTLVIADFGMEDDSLSMTATRENVTGFENLATWTHVGADGQSLARLSVSVSGSVLRIGHRGLNVIIR